MQKLFRSKTSLAIGIGLTSFVILGSVGSILHFKNRSNPIASKTAFTSDDSLENSRAVLASATESIEQDRGQQALSQLQNLEKKYPLLAPYILLKQGKAHQIAKDEVEAEAVWQKLIKEYPDSPAVAEVLYLLGQENRAYWEQAIEQFPQHPRTHQIIRQSLTKNPHQPQLMAIIVKYDPDERDITEISDRLTTNYSSQLTSRRLASNR